MKLTTKTAFYDSLEIKIEDDNFKYESGFLDRNEYIEITKAIIDELMSYETESIAEFIMSEYGSYFKNLSKGDK